jgi:hypothetical protein
MKIFSLVTLFSLGLILSINAQEKQYTPNARQAVQKSRMQQPQYMQQQSAPIKVEVKEVKKAPEGKATPKATPVNYQVQRELAVDAPKRRAKRRKTYTGRLATIYKK